MATWGSSTAKPSILFGVVSGPSKRWNVANIVRPFASRLYKKMPKKKLTQLRKRLEKKGVRLVRKYYDKHGKLRVCHGMRKLGAC